MARQNIMRYFTDEQLTYIVEAKAVKELIKKLTDFFVEDNLCTR